MPEKEVYFGMKRCNPPIRAGKGWDSGMRCTRGPARSTMGLPGGMMGLPGGMMSLTSGVMSLASGTMGGGEMYKGPGGR